MNIVITVMSVQYLEDTVNNIVFVVIRLIVPKVVKTGTRLMKVRKINDVLLLEEQNWLTISYSEKAKLKEYLQFLLS